MYTQTTTGNDSGHSNLGGLNRGDEPADARPPEKVVFPDGSEPCPIEWRPTRAEMLREYPITIEFLTIGCVVSIGCKRIPFTSVSYAMASINEYIEQPYEMREKWERDFKDYK
jgi:hypothetical protein